MKTSTLENNGVPDGVVETISLIVDRIPWPERRLAMAEVTQHLLDGKPRVAEYVFGWSRESVKTGLEELRTGVPQVNDLSKRRKPKTEEKYPQLVEDIRVLMEPQSRAESHLRTALAYTNLTAAAVRNALLEKGWPEETLPKVRTISNMLNRMDYRLRLVAKTKVQKKPQ
jgi:hypothetical protein